MAAVIFGLGKEEKEREERMRGREKLVEAVVTLFKGRLSWSGVTRPAASGAAPVARVNSTKEKKLGWLTCGPGGLTLCPDFQQTLSCYLTRLQAQEKSQNLQGHRIKHELQFTQFPFLQIRNGF
jgi:hypothetical protein